MAYKEVRNAWGFPVLIREEKEPPEPLKPNIDLLHARDQGHSFDWIMRNYTGSGISQEAFKEATRSLPMQDISQKKAKNTRGQAPQGKPQPT